MIQKTLVLSPFANLNNHKEAVGIIDKVFKKVDNEIFKSEAKPDAKEQAKDTGAEEKSASLENYGEHSLQGQMVFDLVKLDKSKSRESRDDTEIIAFPEAKIGKLIETEKDAAESHFDLLMSAI